MRDSDSRASGDWNQGSKIANRNCKITNLIEISQIFCNICKFFVISRKYFAILRNFHLFFANFRKFYGIFAVFLQFFLQIFANIRKLFAIFRKFPRIFRIFWKNFTIFPKITQNIAKFSFFSQIFDKNIIVLQSDFLRYLEPWSESEKNKTFSRDFSSKIKKTSIWALFVFFIIRQKEKSPPSLIPIF